MCVYIYCFIAEALRYMMYNVYYASIKIQKGISIVLLYLIRPNTTSGATFGRPPLHWMLTSVSRTGGAMRYIEEAVEYIKEKSSAPTDHFVRPLGMTRAGGGATGHV